MKQSDDRTDGLLYSEIISSSKTEALFLALMIFFLLLLIWQMSSGGMGILAASFAFFFMLFLFYSVNFRTLLIHLSANALELKFGIFTWIVPFENIVECRLDQIPKLLQMGGAGIHFMTVRKRYRVSFNFLEYPRVVIELKKKAGPVRDISFSTRRPDEVLRFIREGLSEIGQY